MDKETATRAIVEGMERYFRLFALADTVTAHTGDIEWIMPVAGEAGPAIVFRVALEEATAGARIDALLPELDAGTVPGFWVITPTATPANLTQLLLAKGFRDLSTGSNPEPGMALDLAVQPTLPSPSPDVRVTRLRRRTRVQSLDEFAVWAEVVNAALHGWDLIDAGHYRGWLACEDYAFYLASFDGAPAATVATIQSGDCASIEFVGTLGDYRRRGIATAACADVLAELRDRGVRLVTLRSSPEAVSLYERLGFVSYYHQVLVSYHRSEG